MGAGKRIIIFIMLLMLTGSAYIGAAQMSKNQIRQLRKACIAVFNIKNKETRNDRWRHLMRKEDKKITTEFILSFADDAVKVRKFDWLQICRSLANSKWRAAAIGGVELKVYQYHILMGNYGSAKLALQAAVRLFGKWDVPLGEGMAYLKQMEYYLDDRSSAQAMKKCEKALKLFERKKITIGLGHAYLGKGKIYIYRRDYLKADKMLDQALHYFNKAQEIPGSANAYLYKGIVYLKTGQHAKSGKAFAKALKLFKKKGTPLDFCHVYMKRGELYTEIGQYTEAADSFDRALAFIEKENIPICQGHIYLKKGVNYYYAGDFSKAITMYEKAKPYFKDVRLPLGLCNIYINRWGIHYPPDDTKFEKYLHVRDLMKRKVNHKKLSGHRNRYKSKGDTFFRTGEIPKAMKMYKKALNAANKKRNLSSQGNAYIGIGNCYYKMNDHIKAFQVYNKALALFQKIESPIGKGNVFWRKGDVYLAIGKPLTALDTYNKALTLFEETGDPIAQGNIYLKIGNIYHDTGDNLRALEFYNKAFTLLKKSGNNIALGEIYRRTGIIYSYGKSNRETLNLFRVAGSSLESVKSKLKFGKEYIKKWQRLPGSVPPPQAIKAYKKALSFFEAAERSLKHGYEYIQDSKKYRKEDDNPGSLEWVNKAEPLILKAKLLINKGIKHMSKGNMYRDNQDKNRILEMYKSALPFFEQAAKPAKLGAQLMKKAVRIADGKSRAGSMFHQAEKIFKKERAHLYLAFLEKDKGDLDANTKFYSEAVNNYNWALSYFEKEGLLLEQGKVFNRMGDSYLYRKDPSSFIAPFENYYAGRNKVKTRYKRESEASRRYRKKNRTKEQKIRLDNAFNYYNKAIALLRKAGNVEPLAHALYGKAKVYWEWNNIDNAINHFEQSIAILEKVRIKTSAPDMKRTFMEKVYAQYQETVLLIMRTTFPHYIKNNRKDYTNIAFKLAESVKARVFLDRMVEKFFMLHKGIPPDMKEKRDNLIAKLSMLSKEMHKKGDEKIRDLYRETERQFENLLLKIRLDNPIYSSVKYPEPVTVKNLQKDLKNDETLLLFFLSPNYPYVFTISRENFKVIHLSIDGSVINKMVKDYLSALKENRSKTLRKLAKKFYLKLIEPVEDVIKDNKTLIIIPGENLAMIPFETFIIDKEEFRRPIYLLDKYRIKYLQNASLLPILRKYYRRDNSRNHFIGFGDAVYDYQNFKKGTPEGGTPNRSNDNKSKLSLSFRSLYDRAGGLLNRLPRSGEEVQTIAQLFENKSLKGTVYSRAEASEEKAKAIDMKEYDYIHFACHGLLNDEFQSLVLSQLPGEQSTEDGYFTLNEIMNCNWNAKLVVLSACRTGSGKMTKGEGVTGLTRAVMYAGTPAVIASLWDVEDNATKALMIIFYRNLLDKQMDKVEALRQAKLELLRHQKYASPLFWSAFVMYGE
jgi:CHAT domain-containing protein